MPNEDGATILIQDTFERMWRDESRDRLPRGACWNLLNYISGEAGAPAAKRGGWAYASPALTGVQSSADRVISLCDAPFAAGRQLVAVVIDDGGAAQKVAQIVSVGSATDRGATNKPAENLTFYRDKVVICADSGTAVPELYGGASNSTDLTGSPPNGSRSCTYKDHLVLARLEHEPGARLVRRTGRHDLLGHHQRLPRYERRGLRDVPLPERDRRLPRPLRSSASSATSRRQAPTCRFSRSSLSA